MRRSFSKSFAFMVVLSGFAACPNSPLSHGLWPSQSRFARQLSRTRESQNETYRLQPPTRAGEVARRAGEGRLPRAGELSSEARLRGLSSLATAYHTGAQIARKVRVLSRCRAYGGGAGRGILAAEKPKNQGGGSYFMEKVTLAIDIGASSGRHIVGWTEGGRLGTREVYRFADGPQRPRGRLVWDIDGILAHVKAGIREAFRRYPSIRSLSIDTWAVDYVLLDRDGAPIYPCYAYR